jgi:hypothetical protein
VPKCEILDRSDFHYFYTIKPFWVDDFVVKILTYYFNFWGSQASFIFWCVSWAYAWGADAYAQHAHQLLTRMLSARISSWRVCSAWIEGPFQSWNFYAYAEHTHKELMHTLSMRVRNWCACWAYASVPDPHAQGMHKSLMRMLSMFWRECAP